MVTRWEGNPGARGLPRPALKTLCDGLLKYNSPLYHSTCRKDQFTILSLKFGTQDFTDPGLLKIRRTLTKFVVVVLLYKSQITRLPETTFLRLE